MIYLDIVIIYYPLLFSFLKSLKFSISIIGTWSYAYSAFREQQKRLEERQQELRETLTRLPAIDNANLTSNKQREKKAPPPEPKPKLTKPAPKKQKTKPNNNDGFEDFVFEEPPNEDEGVTAALPPIQKKRDDEFWDFYEKKANQ